MQANKHIDKALLVLFSFLLSINTALCQENFQPGAIITDKGDTLKGWIDYRNWGKNPVSIRFKNSENSPVTNYSPMSINAFRVQNELYISAIVTADDSPYQVNELNFDRDIKKRTDTVFLQALFAGTKGLYYNNDKYGKQQFYIQHWPDFELLVYKKYLKLNKVSGNYANSEPARIIMENKNYLGQLALYLQDCPDIRQNIDATLYTQKSLSYLFKTYNKCSKASITYEYAIPKAKVEFGAVAGISSTKLKLYGSKDNLKYIDFKNPVFTNISGGIFFDFALARDQGRWSVYNELLFNSYKNSSHLEDRTSDQKYTITDTKIGFSFLKLNSMVRYKYLVNKDFSLFTNAGIFNGYSITETNSIMEYSKFYEQESWTEKKLFNTTRYVFGYIAGLGAKYKKYSIEARYEQNIPLFTRVYPIGFFFLLGYQF